MVKQVLKISGTFERVAPDFAGLPESIPGTRFPDILCLSSFVHHGQHHNPLEALWRL